MALHHSPRVVTDGLVLCLDAASKESYSGSGTVWRDLAGSNNGTLTNGPTFSSANGGIIEFDGSDDYFTTSTTPNELLGNPNFTISMWVKRLSNEETNTGIWGFGGDITNQGINSWWYDNANEITIDTWGQATFTTGVTYPLNEWVFVTWQKIAGPMTRANCILWRNLVSYTGNQLTILRAENVAPNVNNLGFSFARISPTYSAPVNFAISNIVIYNRILTPAEILQNYNAIKSRFVGELGSFSNPFPSPVFAQNNNVPAGSYYFRSVGMSSPLLLEYQPSYYESKPFCCVFRSPYGSTATTNRIDLNIPMGGLLVQRDALDLRAAVYWSTPITYNSVGGSGNNTADSGYSPRRVMLGFGGGHGIYNINQNQCSWGSSLGGIGAGFDGGTCGTFPDNLVWGTGNNTNTYENRSGTWSHWITWG